MMISYIIKIIRIFGGFFVEWLEYLWNLVDKAGIMGAVVLLLLVIIVFLIRMFSKSTNDLAERLTSQVENQSKIMIEIMGQQTAAITKQMEMQSKAITELARSIERMNMPHLDVELSLDIFKETTNSHIWLKLKVIGDVLRRNDISSRESSIRHNIENEYRIIISDAVKKLSKYKSVCGDMGKILTDSINSIGWTEYLSPIYKIVFSDFKEEDKIKDITGYLKSKADEVEKKIESMGVRN